MNALIVMQLPSVYGKNLSLTGAIFMTVTPYYAVMMHPQLKINDYYYFNFTFGNTLLECTLIIYILLCAT